MCLVDGLALVDQVAALQSLRSVGTGLMTLSMSYTLLVLVWVGASSARKLLENRGFSALPASLSTRPRGVVFCTVNVLCTDDVPPTSHLADFGSSNSRMLVFSSWGEDPPAASLGICRVVCTASKPQRLQGLTMRAFSGYKMT